MENIQITDSQLEHINKHKRQGAPGCSITIDGEQTYISFADKTIEEAKEWWAIGTLEEQFYATIKFNDLIEGDHTRHPDTLTDDEIVKIFKAVQAE